MINIDKDYLITVDLKNTKVKSDKTIFFYNTDLNICNIFIKLICSDKDKTIPDDLIVELAVLKPETNEFKPLDATLISKEDLLYQVDLTTDYFDIVGKYSCEIRVSGTIENELKCFTSEEFDYVVKPNITAKLNKKIKNDKNLPVLEKLIKDVKEITDGINKNEIQMKRDENLVGDNKTIVGAINQLREDVKNSSTPYDDTAIKADIQTLKDNEVTLVKDETSMEGIKDNEYPTLTTTDKTLIGSINEVNAQFKDIANLFTTEQTTNSYKIKCGNKVIAEIPIGGTIPIEPVAKKYTITNTLSNAINSNNATEIEENTSYVATITSIKGYKIDTITITMGENDITSTVYNEGNINIPKVTGNIIINVSAIENVPLSKPFTNTIFDIDTSKDLFTIDSPTDVNYKYKINDTVNNEEIQMMSDMVNVLKNYYGSSNLSQYKDTIIKNRIDASSGSYTLINYMNDVNVACALLFASGHGEIFGGIFSMCNMYDSGYGEWHCYKAKINMPYINSSNEKVKYTPTEQAINGSNLTSTDKFKSYLKQCVAYVLEENGEINIYSNGVKFFHFDAPADFKKWDFGGVSTGVINPNLMKMTNHSAGSIALLNSSFDEKDMDNLYNYLLSLDDLEEVTSNVTSLNLEKGDNIQPIIDVKPITIKKSDCIINSSSSNGNVSIDSNGINAVHNGTANVTYTAKYKKNTVNKIINVNVGKLQYTPTSVRTSNKIIIQNPIDSIGINEEYSLCALVLNAITEDKKTPYEFADDNMVIFESGDSSICSVKNGVLKGVSEGSTNIVAKDITGTITTSMPIKVVQYNEYIPTDAETYKVTLPCPTTNGVLHIDNTNSEKTTKAIQDLLAYCTANNKRKIIFPKGKYLISPVYDSIKIPSNLIIDFNNSDINIEESSKTATGYNMILFENTQNSKIINANIYGERFTMSASNGAESCQSILFTGTCYRSGLENCTISRSPGFNIGARISGLVRCPLKLTNIESGNINNDGSVSNETVDYCYRSIDYIDISSLGAKFGLGNRQGYEGYLYLGARIYDIYFYDTNKQFISSLKDCLQYFLYDKPSNAKYAKVVFYQTTMPTKSDGDFGSVAMIYSHSCPNKCFIRNCTLEDSYSTAIQPNGGDNWVIENNIFRRNGYRDPASQIDWEDGRNNIHGHIVRNNIFEDGGAVTFVGGSCMVFHNNILKNNALNHGDEVQNSRIWLNQFTGKKSIANIKSKTDIVFSQNYFNDGAKYNLSPTSNVKFKIHGFENIIS